MHFGSHEELQLLGLLTALALLLAVAPALRVPVPILLVLGGVILGFVPGMPQLVLPPELVFIAILPPLLYAAAFFTSLRELRTNARPLSFLSIGLVIATMGGVAVVAHEFVGLSWPVAFTLGAIVSPTDALAATEIAGRLHVPRRLAALIEGESLINDGTALVLYKTALAATVAGTFSLLDASWHLALNCLGGVGVGLVVAWVVRQLRRRVDDPPIEIAIAVLTGYLAFLPAELLHVSGVLAAVTAGVYIGWHTPELTTAQTRLTGTAFWEILVFLANALLFVLVGLQLRSIVESLSESSSAQLAGDAIIICAAVVIIRLVWVPVFTYLPRAALPALRRRDPHPPFRYPFVLSWAGIRGAVSLAAALALPIDFPNRDLIIFLTFCVIVTTLVIQGLTLPVIIRVLGVVGDDSGAKEDAHARVKAAEAALARLEELETTDGVHPLAAESLRSAYGSRRDRFRARFDGEDDGAIEERSAEYQRAQHQLLQAERDAVVALRNAGEINDEVMHRVWRDIDLEASRLDAV